MRWLGPAPSNAADFVTKSFEDSRVNRSISNITTSTTLGSTANTDYVVFCGEASYNSVVALLTGDGTNASTTITDSSPLATNWLAAGNAQLSTSVKKFGTASLLFDGTPDYIYPTTAASNFAFGSGDFTIEMWINPSVTAGLHFIYEGRSGTASAARPTIYLVDGTLGCYINGVNVITGSASILTSTWYHVALCRSGTSTKLFVNGVQDGSTYSDSTVYTNGTNRPLIGAADDGSGLGNSGFSGYIDDVRITKGVARYTTTFTPPTASFATPITATLPTAVGNTNQYTVKNVGVTATVATTSSQTIDGAATYSLPNGNSVRLVSDGANWRTGDGKAPTSGAVSVKLSNQESTSSTSFTDLATATDYVTTTVGANGSVFVGIQCAGYTSGSGTWARVAVELSGANTITASTNAFWSILLNNQYMQTGVSFVMTGLAAGSTTFKMKYALEGSAGTGTFLNRSVSVVPL